MQTSCYLYPEQCSKEIPEEAAAKEKPKALGQSGSKFLMHFFVNQRYTLNTQKSSDQIANIHWIIEKAREFQKNIYFCFIDSVRAFDCVDHNKLWKILKKDGNTRPP